MADQSDPSLAGDSLDIVERVMAIEEALINPHLTPGQRERLIRELEVRKVNGEFRDEGDFDDDALTILIRKPGPPSPRGQVGAAAQPEEPFFAS